MSKILVVEPRKILQQAISQTLFPDHEIQVTVALSDNSAAAVGDFDVVIIDAAALRDANSLGPQLARAIQGWKVPTIWIEEAGSSQVPTCSKLIVLKRPIQKHALQSALSQCLRLPSAANPEGSVKPQPKESKAASKSLAKDKKTAAVADDVPKFIELVDVVEEEPSHGSDNPSARKKK